MLLLHRFARSGLSAIPASLPLPCIACQAGEKCGLERWKPENAPPCWRPSWSALGWERSGMMGDRPSGSWKVTSCSVKTRSRSNTISNCVPRCSSASGPRVSNTPARPAAAPAAPPRPRKGLPLAAPAMTPTVEPTRVASATAYASSPFVPALSTVLLSRSKDSSALPSSDPRLPTNSRIVPFGRIIYSNRKRIWPLPLTRPGRLVSVTVPLTYVPGGTRMRPLTAMG